MKSLSEIVCLPVEARYFPRGGTSDDVEAAMVVVENMFLGGKGTGERSQAPFRDWLIVTDTPQRA